MSPAEFGIACRPASIVAVACPKGAQVRRPVPH